MQKTIAIVAPGDMGAGVGQALSRGGHDVVTCLAGRSEQTRIRAETSGFTNLTDLDDVVGEAALILSILPPALAIDLSTDVSAAMKRTGSRPVYMDCNAISPSNTQKISVIMETIGASYIDCGIIGVAPGKGPQPTRFYISGPDLSSADMLTVDGISVKTVGHEIGRASALKMLYSGLNKGRFSLFATVATAAQALDLLDPLGEELDFSQGETWNYMQGSLPRLPADSERWWPEMEQIAETFEAVGVTGEFHRGAAWMMRLMAMTPFASETRETFDSSRTMPETVKTFVEYLRKEF